MKKVTMQQIADHVGVSKFAVSQALSGKPGVASDTREKIIQAATMLGYFSQSRIRLKPRPVTPAELEKRPRNTVIVLVPNVRFQNRESGFWGQIIDGATSALEDRGIRVLMVTEHNTMNFLDIINPDGILGMIGIGMISNRMLLEVRNAGIPFVLVDHEDPLLPSDTVFMNNYDSMRRVTSHLLALGHKELRFVGNPQYSRSFFDRWMGFRTVLEESGIPDPSPRDPLLTFEGGNEQHQVSELVQELALRNQLPTAFVCANDFLALGVLHALHATGSRAKNVSITGFDDSDEARDSVPGLSSVHVPKAIMGKRSVDILLKRTEHPELPIEKTLIYGEFILRASVTPV